MCIIIALQETPYQILAGAQSVMAGVKQRTAAAELNGDGKRLGHRHKAQSIIDSKALDELETEVFETGFYENHGLSRGSKWGVIVAEIIYGEFC